MLGKHVESKDSKSNLSSTVESGVHISIVSDNLLRKIPKRCIRHIQPQFGAIFGIDGATQKVTARVIVTVNIGGHAF